MARRLSAKTKARLRIKRLLREKGVRTSSDIKRKCFAEAFKSRKYR